MVGVKQSGDRLFQLNNLKRKIVDKPFLDWLSTYTKTQNNAKTPSYDLIKAKKFFMLGY